MEYILTLIVPLIIGYFFIKIMYMAGTLHKLQRAIYVADENIEFIEKLKEWEDTHKHTPFTSGVDPYDVLVAIQDAKNAGLLSIKKEIKETGRVQEL